MALYTVRIILFAIISTSVSLLNAAEVEIFFNQTTFLNAIGQPFGVIDFEESPQATTPTNNPGGVPNVTYFDSITIKNVTFSALSWNRNKPGFSLLDGWKFGHPYTFDFYNIGSGNLLIPGLGASSGVLFGNDDDVHIDMRNAGSNINAFGANFGSVQETSPCCVRQAISFKLTSGETITVHFTSANNYQGLGHELSSSDFTGFVITGGTIAGITLEQRGHNPILDNVTWGTTGVRVSKVQVGQTILGFDMGHDGTFDLVKDRECVALVTVETTNEITDPIMAKIYLDGDRNNIIGKEQFNFKAGELISEPVPILFTLTDKGDHKLTVIIDPGNEITVESDDIPVVVHETVKLVVPNVPISPPCSDPLACYGTLTEFDKHVDESNDFIQAVYPVAKGGFSGPKTSEIKGTNFVSRDLELALAKARSKNSNLKLCCLVVPEGYVEYFRNSFGNNSKPCCENNADGLIHCSIGFRVPQFNTVVVQEGHWTTGAHEIGHHFGLNINGGEAYTKNPICGELATNPAAVKEGYFVETEKEVSAVDFMGSDPGHKRGNNGINGPDRWVSAENWGHLMNKLSTSTPDPDIITIGATFRKDGSVNLLPWRQFEGIPSFPTIDGDYSIKFIDIEGHVLQAIPFDLRFEFEAIPFGILDSDFAGFLFSTPYPDKTVSIKIIDPDGNVMVDVDPNIKVLSDAVNELIETVPDECFTNDPAFVRDQLASELAIYKQYLEDDDTSNAIQLLETMLVSITHDMLDNCDPENNLITTKEKLLDTIGNTNRRLNIRLLDQDPGDDQLTLLGNSQVSVSFSNVVSNRRTGALSENATVTNISNESFPLPILLFVEDITDQSVVVTNPDDTNAEGTPFFILDALNAEGFAPGDQLTTTIIFTNPSRARFNFTPNVYTQGGNN